LNTIHKVNLSETQLTLLRALLRHKVIFLVIGGQAISTYINSRKTFDLDIELT